MSQTPTLRPASDFDVETLVAVLNGGYQDYWIPINYTVSQFEFFVRSQGVDLGLSLVVERQGRLAGMAQLARRGERGWVAGLGVLPEFRQQGLARTLMGAMTANAAAAGLNHLQLEVLAQNTRAAGLYRSLGWRAGRQLLMWERPPRAAVLPSAAALAEADPADVLARLFSWHEQPPCWQRQRPALEHYLAAGLSGWLVEQEGDVVAYALSGQAGNGVLYLTDVAVNPAFGAEDAAEALFAALQRRFPGTSIRLYNEPESSALTPAFVAAGSRILHRQHEMTLVLD